MDATRFDAVARFFAQRRAQRVTQGVPGRQALAQASAGLAATGPAATITFPPPDAEHGPTTLFLQSFQSGAIEPKPGAPGTWTLTLEHGLGQTIYFSDRPDRIVGATPTPRFLRGLGFQTDNPPNAALLFANADGEEDVSVMELFEPRYDETTNTATYDIQLLQEFAREGLTLQAQPTEPPDAHTTFGAAHLFIDDCGDWDIVCGIRTSNGYRKIGVVPSTWHDGWCYSWIASGCLPCRPWFDHFAVAQAAWDAECNQVFDRCGGNCEAFGLA